MRGRAINLYLLLFCATICALISFLIARSNNYTTRELAHNAELSLQGKERLAQKYLSKISEQLKNIKAKNYFKEYTGDLSSIYKKEGIAFYIYENDSLCFWSDNQPAVDLYAYASTFNNSYFASEGLPDVYMDSDTARFNVQLFKIRNGWYECIMRKDNTNKKCTIAALIVIKPEYDFENAYINNNFSSWLNLPPNTKLTTEFNYANPAIKSVSGKTLFEIYRSDGLYKNEGVNGYAITFALTAGFLFVLLLFFYLRKKIKNKITLLFTFTVACFVIRSLMIWFKYPNIFYNSILYDAGIFANASSFYFSYLGDNVINSFLIFLCAVFMYKLNYNFRHRSTLFSVIALSLNTLSALFLYFNIPWLIASLINNSTISYNINELFNFSWLSLVGLLSVAFLLFAFYLIVEKTIVSLLSNGKLTYVHNSIFCATAIIMASICYTYNLSYIQYLWPVSIILATYFLRKYKASYNFINTGLVVLTCTLIVFSLFSKYEQLNKKQTFDAISLSLTERQDVIAENEFTKIISAIKTDGKLKNLLSLLPLSAAQIEQQIRQVNFSGYFERYEINMGLFSNDSTHVFKSDDPSYLIENYFINEVKAGFQTICDDLYFIDVDKKPIKYVAKIDIEDVNKTKENTYRLYLQLQPKLAINLGAFPDLLLDKSIESKLQSKDISYAVYSSEKLQSAHGDYEYPLFLNQSFFDDGNDSYRHYQYSYKKNNIIIISDSITGFWQKFTSNSYLFLFFSLIVLISAFSGSLINNRLNHFQSLNTRIQFIFVSIIVLSLTGVVIGTVWVVDLQFESKNKKELISKSHSVLIELQQNIGDLNTLDATYKDYTGYTLKKLALLFGSDISLFTKKGVLFSTSQPAIYEQGLLSKFMHPNALSYFSKQARAGYTQKESIGSLKYLSAYVPLYNKSDMLLGYINLPYFSRQKDLEKELTVYLTTLINIYTILFVVATLVALLVSNLLTKPLRIIKQQISNIKFGTPNESIKWHATDEIGDLVKEYNKMLVKLEKNSELLARSERESAWREMAKQVAHEIKNPLTPMKLNIQHLQRVAKTNPEDMSERVNRVSEILIEQIDTLSHIATEFSNFAQLPKTTLNVVNLSEVLENVSLLFKQNTFCQIRFDIEPELYVKADREQCIRIFTNLLKNAEQAISNGVVGIIYIDAYSAKKNVIIKIKDNGCGIPDHLKAKIFAPNFTTKATGTGLGLAMVKNSVTAFNGEITFTTQQNLGTTFTISLPKKIQL